MKIYIYFLSVFHFLLSVFSLESEPIEIEDNSEDIPIDITDSYILIVLMVLVIIIVNQKKF